MSVVILGDLVHAGKDVTPLPSDIATAGLPTRLHTDRYRYRHGSHVYTPVTDIGWQGVTSPNSCPTYRYNIGQALNDIGTDVQVTSSYRLPISVRAKQYHLAYRAHRYRHRFEADRYRYRYSDVHIHIGTDIGLAPTDIGISLGPQSVTLYRSFAVQHAWQADEVGDVRSAGLLVRLWASGVNA